MTPRGGALQGPTFLDWFYLADERGSSVRKRLVLEQLLLYCVKALCEDVWGAKIEFILQARFHTSQ